MGLTQAIHEGGSSRHRQATILVVDDEKIVRELCEHVLKEYRLLQAGSIGEALRLFEKETVDLILSDIMMPGGSGIELLRQVKSLDPNATVIIMTGFVEKEFILSALKEDADDFINKPLNLIQLKAAIEKALKKKALKEELANIKRADRLKSSFLSLVSHKLRTPITGISLFLQNLQHGIGDANDPQFRENVALVCEETAYLGRLVSDLLAFSQVMISDDGVRREACDLNLIASELLLKSRESQGKPSIEVDFSPGNLPVINLDSVKIHFALQQIIDNAFKFSGEMGHVTLSTIAGNDQICIIVSDSGIGIPTEEIPKIFEKFYQIDPDNTGQIPGFGLGLFYAREFIRQHGGGISLDSEPGLGTTVTISLPLQ